MPVRPLGCNISEALDLPSRNSLKQTYLNTTITHFFAKLDPSDGVECPGTRKFQLRSARRYSNAG